MVYLPSTTFQGFVVFRGTEPTASRSSMVLPNLLITITLLNWGSIILAYPQAKGLGVAQRTYPRAVSGVLQQISVPTNNTTTPPLLPAPVGTIECFASGQGRPSTDVDGCRPTLNYFRTFAKYRVIQDFMEDRYPKLPSKPPYAVHHIHSNCAVQIASEDPYTLDTFSFEQARTLATEILEICQDHGGHGGVAPIGHGIGWRVSVIGFKLDPDLPPA